MDADPAAILLGMEGKTDMMIVSAGKTPKTRRAAGHASVADRFRQMAREHNAARALERQARTAGPPRPRGRRRGK